MTQHYSFQVLAEFLIFRKLFPTHTLYNFPVRYHFYPTFHIHFFEKDCLNNNICFFLVQLFSE